MKKDLLMKTKYLLLFFLSMTTAIISMEKAADADNEIIDKTEINPTENIYFNPSILNEAENIYEAIDIIEKYIAKCTKLLNLCNVSNDLSNKNLRKFRKKIREFYIPYLNKKFLRKREGKEGLYPRNSEWHNDPIFRSCEYNEEIAQFIETAAIPTNTIEASWLPNELTLKMIKVLIFYGLDIETKNECGDTPLHWVLNSLVYPNQVKLIEVKQIILFLLKHGANLNAQDNLGETPLCSAIAHNGISDDIALVLLQNFSPDPNIPNNKGQTPLFLALQYSSDLTLESLIKFLLESGANPNTNLILHHVIGKFYHRCYDSSSKKSPFYDRCKKLQDNITALLLKYGADPFLQDSEQKNAFDLAKESNFHDFPQLVEKYAKCTY